MAGSAPGAAAVAGAGTGVGAGTGTRAAAFDRVWPDVQRHMRDVMDCGVYSNGPKTRELEGRIKELTGVRYAMGVGTATDGLLLMLRAAGIGRDDEVVVPAFAPVTAAMAVALAGARVVFADVDPVTYGLSPESLRAVVTSRTKAVIPSRQFAAPRAGAAATAEVRSLARSLGLRVFEDLGGSPGAAACAFSAPGATGGVLAFDPAGELGALGDAAMVLTDDPELAADLGALRNHGRRPGSKPPARGAKGLAEIAEQGELPGTNAKMDDLQAAVVLGRLSVAEAVTARRGELARAYTERLAGLIGVERLPSAFSEPFPDVVYPGPYACAAYPVRYLAEVTDRDALARYLTDRGFAVTVPARRPLHLQPAFAPVSRRAGDLPAAEAAARRTIALPLHPDLTLNEVERVCAAVRSFYAGSLGAGSAPATGSFNAGGDAL
ncbi:DegT/DnrJ/EryC1/StrS family aminotransferase [Streptomyces sp. NPDC097619]|uniref:DegT/DnrJ/EryC1/StrS family aminotransferase n=1 Tax=Streptomyces sp. NPDC097619 TaxID=3157228 RepID=UPI0033260105